MDMTEVTVVAGDTSTVEFAYRSQDIDGTVTPIDLTGVTTTLKVKDSPGGTVSATYTGTVTDATDGRAKYTVTETEPGTKWYQAVITVSGAPETVAYGPLVVLDV